MNQFEHKKGKIYYSMGEVSEMFDVNPSLIRFWESKFDILKPRKNRKGNRMFTPEDIDNLKLIYHLVKENGMTLAGARKLIKENREGVSRDMEVVDRLLAIKSILMEIKQELTPEGELVREDDTEQIISDAADNKHGGKYIHIDPSAEPVEAASVLEAETKWLSDELDELDQLDEKIDELSVGEAVSTEEADDLLEKDGNLELSPEEGSNDTEDLYADEGYRTDVETESKFDEVESSAEPSLFQFSDTEMPHSKIEAEKLAEESKRPHIYEQTLF